MPEGGRGFEHDAPNKKEACLQSRCASFLLYETELVYLRFMFRIILLCYINNCD